MPMVSYADGVNSSAIGSFPITPSDSADLALNIRMVTINVGGTLSWVNWQDEVETTALLPAGSYPIQAKRIRATGTTATGLTGWV